MTIDRIVPAFLAVLLLAGSIGYAQAADRQSDEQDAAALAGMKISLPQAITAAEQQVGGRAVSADVRQSQGVTRIAVEVAGPQGIKTVQVDGQSGQVVPGSSTDGDGEDND